VTWCEPWAPVGRQRALSFACSDSQSCWSHVIISLGVWDTKTRSRGAPGVRGQHAAEPVVTAHRAHRGDGLPAWERWAELERSVRPGRVVVAHVLVQDALEVPWPQDQQPVQAVAAHRAHPALGERVGLKRQLPLVRTVRDGSASRTPSTRCAASALSC